MKILCFDPVGGAAGDMILASLLDLGASLEKVEAAVRSTGLAEFSIQFEQRQDENGIVCGFCDVRNEASHDHDASHGHHHGRHLSEILEMIASGDLPDRAKSRAESVFRRLADAEGAVHGISPEKVHFHEVGAVDSIVDIVGSCVAMELLEVDEIRCSELKIGHGTITCAHGTLPVPAPATSKLIEGHPVRRLDVQGELTTPTGAALLTALTSGAWNDLPLSVSRIGTGHGHRNHPAVPNVIRAFLCESLPDAELLTVMEADIDDDTPERLAFAADRLREEGALDVVMLPLQMKKGRCGIRISVLTRSELEPQMAKIILDETGTIGVRSHSVRRYALPRESMTVATPWGPVRVKSVRRPSGIERVPEFEDCRRLAEEHGVPLRKVMLVAMSAGLDASSRFR